MLRHYDAVGVLVPAVVDPVSGYRFYQAGQLPVPGDSYVDSAQGQGAVTVHAGVQVAAERDDWLAAHGAAPAGAPFLKYNVIDMARQLEIEAGVPVATAVDGDSRVLSGILPAGRAAEGVERPAAVRCAVGMPPRQGRGETSRPR
jgi:hypothetical protein